MSEIVVGTAKAAPGARGRGHLRIGTLPDGTPMQIPVMIVNGAKPGPRLWVEGCVHGNEHCGIFITHRFVEGLDPAAMTGAVVALPVLNLTAMWHNRRTSPFEVFHGGDLNRMFPGRPDGNLTEQMAHAIFQALIANADYMIDMHTAQVRETRWALFTNLEGEVGRKAETMARAWGYGATFPTPPTTLTTAGYMQAAIQKGIPGLIVECGGKGPAFGEEEIADGAARMRNVARAIGILDEPVVPHPGMEFVGEFAWIRSTKGGLFRHAVMPGDRVQTGQVIGKLYDVFGKLREEVKADKPGIVLNICNGPLMMTGDTLIHLGVNPRPA